MKCSACKSNKPMKAERVKHNYAASGLENVVIDGVNRYTCHDCGSEELGFFNLVELHSLIASMLITKPGHLDGRELTFLRTQLGYSKETLATLIGINEDTIYRYETSKRPAPIQYQNFLRIFVAQKQGNREYDIHDHHNEKAKSKTKIGLMHITSQNNHWMASET